MPPATAKTAVYVGNSDTQEISVLELTAEGELLARATVPLQQPVLPGRSMLLAASPTKKFLYAGFMGDEKHSAVATYAIDAQSGALRWLGRVQLPALMAYLTTDRSGRFLLAASYAGDKVTVNAIAPDGTVGDAIYQDRFDAATGRLEPRNPPTVAIDAKAGPRFLIFSRDGKFVYLVNELDGSLDVLPFDAAAGTLGAKLQTVTVLPPGFTGKAWAADIHLVPNGRFLYASERTSSTLAGFQVDAAAGTLTPIGSFPTVEQPRAFAIDPSGRYLLSSGQRSNSLAVHRIDPADGKLSALKEYPVGKNPTWVEIVGL
jgi:6-phosphogluconolactonase